MSSYTFAEALLERLDAAAEVQLRDEPDLPSEDEAAEVAADEEDDMRGS